MNPNKKFKCPFCKVHDTKEKLINHIEKKHQEMIPEGFSAARVLFHAIHKRPYNVKGSCVICKGETEWNEKTYKYNRLCNRRECKDKLRDSYKKNMLKVYGTYNILNDMDQQEKMLANRSISGVYKFRNGKLKQFVGSYEKKFLEFCDLMLNMDPDDIMMPGPTIEYEYKGEKHQWITDAMIIPYNLLIDVKDGSSNPNNREMISYREKQIEKEKVITNKGEYNYLRLTNNEFDQLIGIIYELKMQMIEDPETTKTISRVHESYDPPMNEKQIREKYPDKADILLKDPVHKWRAEKGIELIHKEPSKKELDRIWNNWNKMSDEQKKESDEYSKKLFGKTNKDNYEELIKSYDESSIISDKDMYCNFDEFSSGKKHICFVIGLPGSGKSTLSKKIAKQYDAEYVELDLVMYAMRRTEPTKQFFKDKNNMLIWEWIQKTKQDFSEIRSLPKDNVSLEKRIEKTAELVEWLIKDNKKRCVVEGVDLIRIMAMKTSYLNLPIVFKGTSRLKSMYRYLTREGKLDGDLSISEKIKIIKDMYAWHSPISDGSDMIKKYVKETDSKIEFKNESSQPLLISEKDVEYRVDDFRNHKVPVLWITGMSGGGKTTTAKNIANIMSCDLIGIDDIGDFLKSVIIPKNKKELKEWIYWNKNYKTIYDCLKNKSEKEIKNIDDDINNGWKKFLVEVLHKLINTHSNNNQLIIEGVQIGYLYNEDRSLFENSAIIIKGTSTIVSAIRRQKRDGTHFIGSIDDVFGWFNQYKRWHGQLSNLKNSIKESDEEYTNNFVLPIDTAKFKSNKFLLCINTHNANATLTLVDIVLNNPLSFKQYTGLASNWNEQKEARDFILIDSNNPFNFDESFEGTNVRAIGDGKIVLIKKNYAQYGNCICINHGSCISTYCHLKDNSVKVNKGDTVKCGQVIGKIGSTGNSDIPHLHFELTERPFKSGIKATGFNMYEYIELEESDLWGVKDFKKVTDKCKAGRWIRSKSDELPQYCIIKDNTMKTITESVKIPEIKPEDIQFIKAYDGTNNSYITYKGDNYRVRVETLIVNNKDEVYIDKSDKYAKYGIQYRIPGGSVEPNRDFVTQAENECKEEVHINIKNAYYSGQNWVMLFPPNSNSGIPNFSYKGCISYIYVAEYNGKYHGYVKVADRDDMYKTGKFYKYKDVKWLPEHKQALDDYFKSHTKV